MMHKRSGRSYGRIRAAILGSTILLSCLPSPAIAPEGADAVEQFEELRRRFEELQRIVLAGEQQMAEVREEMRRLARAMAAFSSQDEADLDLERGGAVASRDLPHLAPPEPAALSSPPPYATDVIGRVPQRYAPVPDQREVEPDRREVEPEPVERLRARDQQLAQLGTAEELLHGRPAPQPPLEVPEEAAPAAPPAAPPVEAPEVVPRTAPVPPVEVPPVAEETTPPGPPGDPEIRAAPTEEDRATAEIPQEQLLLERGAILLPAGTLQIEPSFDYTRFSGSRVAIRGLSLFEAIVIGAIRVDRFDRDVLTTALTARYGILDRLQAEFRLPLVYREDEEVLSAGTQGEVEVDRHKFDLGDVSAALSFQPLIGGGAVPDIIVRTGATFPTGTDIFEIEREEVAEGIFRPTHPPTGSGFFSVSAGANFVWRYDPVVFFTGGSYKFNLERDVGGAFGTVNPGDVIELLAGLNVALSDRAAINMSFVDQIIQGTRQNGRESPGTEANDGRMIFGTSIGLVPNVSLLASAGIGLTDDAPDFQFTLSLPITLKLFD